MNRGIQMVDARGGIVTLAYDANNNLLSLTDPVANQTQWSYDALNRAVQELDPLSNVSTAVYDAIDRKTSATDKIGQRLAFNYDLLNRETSETWLNTSGVTVNNLTYTFDANDNLLSQSWPVAGVPKTSTMSWDALDRLSTMNESFGTLLTSSYDAESNRILIQDSFGGITTRTFDALNRMATISFTGQSTALREDFAYTVRDQVAGQTRYSNLTGTATVGYSTFTYDGVGRLTNLRHANASGSNIANFTNAYDLASRITSEVLNAGLPTTYQYDSTDQLTNDSVVSYSYDLNGNRTMMGYATGPANELTSDGTWNYAYDKNGNLIQKTNISTGEVFAFGYDIRNRMVTATDTTISSLQMQATYGYDALNQRIQKNVEMGGVATITEFAYDNGQIWVDMNSSNALQTRYLRTDRVLELLSQVTSAAGTATWMLADRMGSLRNVVNSTGAIVDTIVYDGFGNVTGESSSGNGGSYKYAGYWYESETGLYLSDLSSRYYDPIMGRFRKQDQIGFSGGDSNLFRYCGNGPVNWIDPTGFQFGNGNPNIQRPVYPGPFPNGGYGGMPQWGGLPPLVTRPVGMTNQPGTMTGQPTGTTGLLVPPLPKPIPEGTPPAKGSTVKRPTCPLPEYGGPQQVQARQEIEYIIAMLQNAGRAKPLTEQNENLLRFFLNIKNQVESETLTVSDAFRYQVEQEELRQSKHQSSIFGNNVITYPSGIVGATPFLPLRGSSKQFPFLRRGGQIGMIAAGAPLIDKGKSRGMTSVASIVSRKVLPYNLPFRMRVRTPFGFFRMVKTRGIGAIVGRTIPYVGWFWLAADLTVGILDDDDN